jgi:hypothetical protein
MSPTVRFATIPVTRRGRADTGGLGGVETRLEHERSVDQLEQGLSDLRMLYLKLASAHLGLDYRGGFMLAPGGFDAMYRGMLGRLTLYMTDDDTPEDQRKDETDLNPRGRWLLEMHTRNAKRLERRMTRHFLGVCAGMRRSQGDRRLGRRR